LTIKELGRGTSERGPLTFAQLKPSLMNLLINALQVESDPQNAQMLLGKRYHLISTDSLKLLIATEACLFAQGHSLEIV
jgi:hypothetical protein